jgi:hypothetical protein
MQETPYDLMTCFDQARINAQSVFLARRFDGPVIFYSARTRDSDGFSYCSLAPDLVER